jgi:hypothetical protein
VRRTRCCDDLGVPPIPNGGDFYDDGGWKIKVKTEYRGQGTSVGSEDTKEMIPEKEDEG